MKTASLVITLCALYFQILGQVAGNPKLVKDFMSDNSAKQTSYQGIEFKGKYFFDHLGDLWSSDGTEQGTSLVKDLNPLKGSFIAAMKVMNNRLFFVANDSAHGYELWSSDGSSNGTHLLKDINPASDSIGVVPFYNSDPLPELNGELYFYADDGINGIELWKTDGTSDGTVMVKNIHPSGNALVSASQYQIPTENVLIVSNGKKIFFAANDSIHGEELWISDGTTQGTYMVKDIDTISEYGASPNNLMLVNDKVVFFGHQLTLDDRLYVSDGTSAGTQKLVSATTFGVNEHAILNGKLFFYSMGNGTGTRGLWVTDGTPGGTALVYYCFCHNTGIFPYRRAMASYNGKVYFDGEGKLWETDGSTQGTKLIFDIGAQTNPIFLTQFGDYLYFRAADTNGRSEMYVTNGTDIELKTLDDYDFTTKSSLVRRYMATGNVTKVGVKLFFWNTYYNNTGNALYTISLFPEEVKPGPHKGELTLWPNPAADRLYFGGIDAKAITIYDLTGNEVYNSVAPNNQTDITIKELPAGTYYFVAETAAGSLSKPFVKL